ncbi:LLM class flavin-dependent oxidoreductase [Agrobacterium rhizogenes]|uniref:LLM class flavin-dependent oxidoreductase n=1 Tax=Rhizobium rhizogenes TaxID=359 RepID=UPI00080FA2EB|nr:LLM class flavin-dependent oxidoreductase [Rhizobium rhizogenes]OCJ22493.1 monooxygenase [Agrobacterium sp. B131/95]OCJ28517.1 monooxygenase [Agrobacterium sp. B133/95]NTI46326.1 LLM class flavin-dependent oxidoreductase [Rhizobium rhizogenes]NTI53010.1 LLM class flavin-dependent oxidoreductase [Rhizobium rhizogenes]NTI98383.1 LLM class flavin-dependent oxidoreductase [Rhizobium rhizogenes]
MTKRELHLNVNALNSGFHGAAWRASASNPAAFLDIDHFLAIARTAERGTFDAVFMADIPVMAGLPRSRPYQALEPTVVLAAMAVVTEKIGLIATASTTFNDPYNLARRLLSLDHSSHGRCGWNVVTTADASAARNFGYDQQPPHHERYQRADAFTQVVKKLWDSWEEGAFVGDKATGLFIDTDRIHPIAHKDDYYSVQGPLSLPRSQQGYPVLLQAGGSDDGRDLAAKHAEAIFSIAQTIDEGTEFAADVRRRVLGYGRSGPILILPGLSTLIGSTETEVKRREEELWGLYPENTALDRLAVLFRIDVGRLHLDKPLPDDIEMPANGDRTFAGATLTAARRDNLTARQLIRRLGGSIGHRFLVGTPKAIADDIEAWFVAGAADGFNLMPDVLPDGLTTFVDEVVPLLRAKGIFRTHYTGRTLRDHFGLPVPLQNHGAPAHTSSAITH